MLIDMILAQGQKDDFGSNSIQKCWGYADITVGNLRVTYQVGASHILAVIRFYMGCDS